ncbi:hypothetical protein PHJA_000883700 [Phtheirospermum japonicum]|uniref:Uncharacterized protein n=1 Tax=Phtheirospermum japonicum TaxID=374723 RepID=A0A830BIH8_9LAMI|nr:hypothetical protein PHJA_000883700 [Phtheirospermum japonicum]
MEEDKKKRKNKNKKKNKQANKQTESEVRESNSESQSHVPEIEPNSNGQASEAIDSSNDVAGHIDVGRGESHANGNRGTLAEAEKQYWLDREASFQEKVKELEAEKDAQIQKESFLEERIKQLLKENTENAQKEGSEREKVKQLQDEKNASMQNEALLEERIKQLMKEKDENAQKEASEREKIKLLYDEKNKSMQNEVSLKEKLMQLEKEKNALSFNEGIQEQKILQLQNELEAHLQRVASIEVKILQLEGEKDSWVQKEVAFEDKVNQLVDEAAFSNLTKHETQVSLEEKIKQMDKERDSWILKENSAEESVASLTNENTKLRAQVIELEQSRESLLEEKQQLTQSVSSLQLQLNNLANAAGNNKVTSEDGDANYRIEAARALVEKLVTENSELVEKVNELYAELDRRGVKTEQYSSAGSVSEAVTNQFTDNSSALVPDLTVGVSGVHSADQATELISEASNMIPTSSSAQLLENVIVEDQSNGELVKTNDGRGLENSSEIIEADEIVQIPLDEGEMKENNVGLHLNDDERTDDVFITDAPLIGAPFRLISFVARYVSGADLVDKNTGK